MNCQVSFGGIPHTLYDEVYKVRPNANGSEPDKNILRIFQRHFRPGSTIADVGAGNSVRNILPLLNMGYQVDAFEISELARQSLQKKAKDLPNLRILEDDILKKPLEKEKYDMIFMSHLSQHFDEKELENVLNNFFKGLKKGGTAIFDALIDKTNKLPPSSFSDVIYGQAYFKNQVVKKLAEKSKFDTYTRHFNEAVDTNTSADYLGLLWGFGHDAHPEYRPLKLKWFILKKKS